jgi:deoxyribonucleoside regulator
MAGHDSEESVRLMTRAAVMYYRQSLTQQEIADRLGMSRATVGRVLARAEETGIVTIQISSHLQHVVEYETALEQAFGLVEAVVIDPSEPGDENVVRSELGGECADILARRIKPGMTIGLGWSRTVQHIAPFLRDHEVHTANAKRITVVQLDGATMPHSGQQHPIFGIVAVASELHANEVLLPAPLYVANEATAKGLLNTATVRDALSIAARADICFFGIGDLSPETTLYVSGDITREELDHLEALGAVGDICGRYYDAAGHAIEGELASRTISVPLDVLATRPLRVAAAAGAGRVDAILGALRGGLANALVTDSMTAQALLSH